VAYSINKQIILGAAGQDANAKVTPNGAHITEISIATSWGVKQKDGTYKNETTWHSVVAFSHAAEALASVKKGDKVYIDGRTETQSWDDRKTGEKRYKNRVIVDNYVIFAKDDEPTQSTNSAPPPAQRPCARSASQAAQDFQRSKSSEDQTFIQDEDIPF